MLCHARRDQGAVRVHIVSGGAGCSDSGQKRGQAWQPRVAHPWDTLTCRWSMAHARASSSGPGLQKGYP